MKQMMVIEMLDENTVRKLRDLERSRLAAINDIDAEEKTLVRIDALNQVLEEE